MLHHVRYARSLESSFAFFRVCDLKSQVLRSMQGIRLFAY